MDEPLPELCAQPVSTTLPYQRYNPRRRPDRKFATPIVTPAQSPERKRQNAKLDGLKTGIERTKESGFISNVMGVPTHANRGQQFTVGNISNGLIYLRPVIRPAHDLQQQKFVLPPNTPPSSAEERDGKGWHQEHVAVPDRQVRKQLPPTPPPKTPPRTRCGDGDRFDAFIKSSPPIPRTRHHRAHSYSTINDNCQSFKPPDFGGFRMKVDQVDGPTEERARPRTAGHPNSFQTLDVQIPHYNLGSPHFSPNGTPFLYGASSLHVPSLQGELGSASTVSQQTDVRWLWPGADPTSLLPSAIPSPMHTPSIISSPTPDIQIPLMSLSALISPSPQRRIGPEIFDDLSFPPTSEDPLIVRYDPRTQEISAAIPARIISQITSAKFVDYHLLSDFFLTFRLFMSPSDLVAYLTTRLRWAFNRHDDTGRVVRVRTFVAIRHWLLNYFADDFVPSLPLREQFVNAMNDLSNRVRDSGNPSDMKIIRELKRCWRRTCILYWDTPMYADISIDQDIIPGGSPGVRYDISRPPSSILRPRTAAPRLESLWPDNSSGTDAFIRQVVEGTITLKDRREKSLRFISRPSSNPGSEVGAPSLPCFAPERASTTGRATPPAQPVHSPLKPKSTKALTPTTSTNTAEETQRKIRPSPHKRSGSFSDALRDTRQPLPLPKSLARSTHLLMAFPYAGSLVRGNLFPPTPAYVEVVAPSTPIGELATLAALTTLNSSNSGTMGVGPSNKVHDSMQVNKTANGPGMKKFLGSVRRALGGKAGGNLGGTPPSAGRPLRQRSPLGVMPENLSVAKFMAANASGTNARMLGDSKATRIDLLGAGVVEAFEKAIQEEMAAEEIEWELEDLAQVSEQGSFLKHGGTGLDGVTDGRGDETAEVGSNVSQDGSASPDLACIAPGKSSTKQKNTYNEEGSLRSFETSKVNLPLQNRGDGLYPDTGSSVETDSIVFSGNTRLPRRSKSFSFESFQRNPYLSQFSGMDSRSLHSARSFSIKRINSGRSQYSNGMDGISETFGNLNSPEDTRKDDLQPSRMLRRRPGGDLRAAATMGNLEMPRPRSAGSVDTTTFSTADTFGVSIYHRATSTVETSRANSPHQQYIAGVVSLGAVAQGGGVSIRRAFESQGRLSVPRSLGLDPKVSFEVGVQKLRDLPDTESDDGGIEVALMKLEGTYQKGRLKKSPPSNIKKPTPIRSYESQDSSLVALGDRGSGETLGLDGVDDGEDHLRRMKRRQKQVFDHAPLQIPPTGAESLATQSIDNRPTKTVTTDNGSEVSLPILERGLSIDTSYSRQSVISNQPVPTHSHGLSDTSAAVTHRGLSPRPSPDDTALRGVDSGLKKHLNKSRGYIKDNVSEISSELSFEIVQPEKHSPSTFPPMQAGTIIAELGIPSHPLRHSPSPPITLDKGSSNSLIQTKIKANAPPEGSRGEASQSKSSGNASSHGPGDRPHNDLDTPIRPSSLHLPFILAYDSELLAKQFTLIEKDALMEVDWKELVELRWSQTSSTVRDWVEFLHSKDIRGVEVVIARFNLMCKWARSEIVMTKDIHERAKTIVKLIHIAAHARRLQNFATMYQITIALLTADVARLRRTWSLISTADLSTFKEMEALVQPVRNFHNLRTEMDKVTGESGCIPFVGIFTHDLILNAQRPLFIVTSPTTEPLVNFERHRTTAAIVKRLLRLIEASHKYDFKAVDGVCERCLWIASVSDEEIRDLSKGLD